MEQTEISDIIEALENIPDKKARVDLFNNLERNYRKEKLDFPVNYAQILLDNAIETNSDIYKLQKIAEDKKDEPMLRLLIEYFENKEFVEINELEKSNEYRRFLNTEEDKEKININLENIASRYEKNANNTIRYYQKNDYELEEKDRETILENFENAAGIWRDLKEFEKASILYEKAYKQEIALKRGERTTNIIAAIYTTREYDINRFEKLLTQIKVNDKNRIIESSAQKGKINFDFVEKNLDYGSSDKERENAEVTKNKIKLTLKVDSKNAIEFLEKKLTGKETTKYNKFYFAKLAREYGFEKKSKQWFNYLVENERNSSERRKYAFMGNLFEKYIEISSNMKAYGKELEIVNAFKIIKENNAKKHEFEIQCAVETALNLKLYRDAYVLADTIKDTVMLNTLNTLMKQSIQNNGEYLR